VLEPTRIFLEGCSQDHFTATYHFVGQPIVHLFGGQQCDATVVMLRVIPEEKSLAKATAILEGAELFRELRTVLQGFELGFRIRVVIADMRPAVSFSDPQVRKQLRDDFRFHARSAVGVYGQLARRNLLLAAALLDQAFGQCLTFTVGDHPACDVAAEDIDDDVQIEVGPLGRPLELGDVPGPNLVGSSGQQFGFAVMRLRDVPAPFFDLLVFGGQDAIHRPRRAQVLPVVEQGSIDLQRRLVLETLAVKHCHHRNKMSGKRRNKMSSQMSEGLFLQQDPREPEVTHAQKGGLDGDQSTS